MRARCVFVRAVVKAAGSRILIIVVTCVFHRTVLLTQLPVAYILSK